MGTPVALAKDVRTFTCTCGARLFFENTRCLACDAALGFRPDELRLVTIPDAASPGTDQTLRRCAKYVENGVCNWLVTSSSPDALCVACRLIT